MAVRRAADRALQAMPATLGVAELRPARHGRPSRRFRRPVNARELGDSYISTEHLLIGLAHPARPRRCVASGEVASAPSAAARVGRRSWPRCPASGGRPTVTSPDPEGTFQALEKYSVDLTAARPRGHVSTR